jgi:hypothetical protein
LTTKDKSVYISLAFTETNDAIVVITNLFKQFIDLVNQYPNCKLTFLEVPHYSIVRWNTTRGHRQPEVFATQDNTLHEQIEAINQVIHTLNREQLSSLLLHSVAWTSHASCSIQIEKSNCQLLFIDSSLRLFSWRFL